MSDRYARQTLFRPIGNDGQRRLETKHVLIVGAGALGSGCAETLVRAGIGRLTLIDRDYVEMSNLQRQSLYAESDASERLPKAAAAEKRLREIRSDCRIDAITADCTANELMPLLDGVDLIIDATDNFETRFVMNDCAYRTGIPWVYGACSGSSGASFPFVPGRTPCLQCLLEEMPLSTASCDIDGIIAPAVLMAVAMQTSAALRLLTGNAADVEPRLTQFDSWQPNLVSFGVSERLRRTDCPTCGANPTYPFLQRTSGMKSEVLCGRDTVMIRPPARGRLDLTGLAERIARAGGQVQQNPYLLHIDLKRDGQRIVVFPDGRALVHGTGDPALAKRIYQRYVGG